MTVLIYIVAGIALVAFSLLYNHIKIRNLRIQGLYPEQGKATMQHVENLVRSGYRIYAIRAYREVHNVSLKQAKKAVAIIINAA